MIAYVDSSALAKLYLSERGSDAMQSFAADVPLATSTLSYLEIRSAIARLRRDASLPESDVQQAQRLLDAHRPYLTWMLVDIELLNSAAELCDRYPLRPGDAVQLASANRIRVTADNPRFLCCDVRLLAAARAEGFGVFNPGM